MLNLPNYVTDCSTVNRVISEIHKYLKSIWNFTHLKLPFNPIFNRNFSHRFYPSFSGWFGHYLLQILDTFKSEKVKFETEGDQIDRASFFVHFLTIETSGSAFIRKRSRRLFWDAWLSLRKLKIVTTIFLFLSLKAGRSNIEQSLVINLKKVDLNEWILVNIRLLQSPTLVRYRKRNNDNITKYEH